ncbi:MAG: hypothetical protein MZW92_35665 [Comamonadaceae bacterium]|nr:hypothetical protein [Comamonadaceae bacterium]
MTQPFCDGSHEGTGMEPMSFVIKEKTTVWLCNCKHTRRQAFCDGPHNDLPDDIFNAFNPIRHDCPTRKRARLLVWPSGSAT